VVRAKGNLNLGERQFASGGVVIEQFGVAAPLDGGFQLPAGLFFAEMFVQKIAEKFIGKGAIGFGFQGLFHLAEKRDVGESRFTKHGFARLNVRARKFPAFRSDDGVAFLKAQGVE
jgi:hypothetical protein